jgi:hypothetical protein
LSFDLVSVVVVVVVVFAAAEICFGKCAVLGY